MPKITSNRLRQIINEEIKKLHEGDREDQAAAMATAASKLLKAIEAFKSAASAKAKSTMDPKGSSLDNHLKEAEKMLKRIVASPLEHVDGQKPQTLPKAPVQPAQAGDLSQPEKKVSIQPSVEKKAEG